MQVIAYFDISIDPVNAASRVLRDYIAISGYQLTR
jgi:hypothetical protein